VIRLEGELAHVVRTIDSIAGATMHEVMMQGVGEGGPVDRARADGGGRVRGLAIRRVGSPTAIKPACPKEGKSATGGAFGRPFFVARRWFRTGHLAPDNGPSQGPAPKGALACVNTSVEFRPTQARTERTGKIALIRHGCRHPVHFK